MKNMTELYQKVEQFVSESFGKAGKASSVKHFERTVYWVQQLKPDADEALLIATIAHDIERAFGDPGHSEIAEKGFRDEKYLTYHQERGAEIIADFLQQQSADEKLIKRVKMLISKHEVGGDIDQDVLRDADSVSFFENNADHFVTQFAPKFGKEKVKDKFNWMFNRISDEKAKKIALPWYKEAIKQLGC